MIPKDLKVNDTFTDEGREYRVTKVTDMGYESIATDYEAKEISTEEVETDEEAIMPDDSETPIEEPTEPEMEEETIPEIAETESDDTETEQPEESTSLICQYCGKECKSMAGLASHEKACKENPTNKEA